MASPKTSTINRGFTLIEMLIVIGLIAVVGSAYLFIDLNSFRGDSFRAEQSTIVTLLSQARIDSLNNISEMPHGVALFPPDAPDSYVVFAGSSYAASVPSMRAYYKSNYNITFQAGAPSEIVFEQLSGDSNYSGTTTLVDPNRSLTLGIHVNSEGGLDW